jgi:hypothetical protein
MVTLQVTIQRIEQFLKKNNVCQFSYCKLNSEGAVESLWCSQGSSEGDIQKPTLMCIESYNDSEKN